MIFWWPLAAAERTRRVAPKDQIPLTRNEIAHLLATLIIAPAHSPAHRLH